MIVNIKHFLRNSRQYLFCRHNEVTVKDYKYFILLDSKVPNIVEQIYPYFEKEFFSKDEVLIVYRHHFENIKAIKKAIKKFSLKGHCFINLRDIPSVKDGIWFYTHNSMTNLAGMNKNVYSKHVWMGHGDSEKVSSYKKIIRIYDYCLVSGERAIERFYQYGIFRKEESYRFLRVGRAVLCSVLPFNPDKVLKKAILFAPTWEGPMKGESYSTLHLSEENATFIKSVSQQLDIDTVIIKLHPNTGIRDSKTVKESIKTIQAILELNKKIIFISEIDSWVYSFIYKKFKQKLEYRDKLHEIEDYQLEMGITNISAMASMIAVEGIKTLVLYDEKIEEQKKVEFSFIKKVNLRQLEPLYSFDYGLDNDLLNYESAWESLSQRELFTQVVKRVSSSQ